jgi:hypothetical protein
MNSLCGTEGVLPNISLVPKKPLNNLFWEMLFFIHCFCFSWSHAPPVVASHSYYSAAAKKRAPRYNTSTPLDHVLLTLIMKRKVAALSWFNTVETADDSMCKIKVV